MPKSNIINISKFQEPSGVGLAHDASGLFDAGQPILDGFCVLEAGRMADQERTKGQRIAYLNEYITKLLARHRKAYESEMVETCVEALEKQIDRIIDEA